MIISDFSVTIQKYYKDVYVKGIVKMSHVNVIFISFQGYFDMCESSLLYKSEDFDIWYSPGTFRHNFSLQIYAAQFQWRPVIFIGKNLWTRVVRANKKQVSLKSYSRKIRTDSVNQILKNKEKVT